MNFRVHTDWGVKLTDIRKTATYMRIQEESDTDGLRKKFQDQIFWALYGLMKKVLIRRKAALIVKYWICGYRKGMNKELYDKVAYRLTANYYPKK